jgi:hypothetical protein
VRDVVVGVRAGMRHTLFAITDLPQIFKEIIDISEKMFYQNNDFIYYLKLAKKI